MTMNDNHSNGTPPDQGGKSGQGRSKAAKREAVAFLLASGKSAREAAREAGVGERSLRRWLHDDADFHLKLMACRTAIFAEAVGRLTTLGGQAAAVLGELLTNESAGIRLRSASAILQHLAPGFAAVEARQVMDLGKKILARSKQLDDWQKSLTAQQAQLDDQRLRANGAGGLHGR
jgi:transposase-like protein